MINKKNKHKARGQKNKEPFRIRNLAVIGAGAFGTSIARVVARTHPDCSIKLWAYEKELVNFINQTHINDLYLPGIVLPEIIFAVSSFKQALKNAEAVIFATPSKVLFDITRRVKKYVPEGAFIGYLTKGFCRVNGKILPMSKALSRVFPSQKNTIAAIYGPSHAEEVSIDFHTCLTVASASLKARKFFVNLLNCDYISCRETDDIIGVDLGTTLKNPAAIAAGMLSVLPRCGDNLAGALISEALNEMLRFAKEFKAREETIIGITGLGDLVATALSNHSRNRRFGRDIANHILNSGTSFSVLDRLIMIIKPEYAFEKMSEGFNYLAEGIYVIEPILELAEQHDIPMPVYRSLYEILLNKKDPRLLIETVKNPEKFEEIFERTKIYVTGRKKGLEKKRGGIFKKTILENSIGNLLNRQNLEADLTNLRNRLIKNYEDNSITDDIDREFSEKEYELFKNTNFNDIEKELSALCRFYIEDISDNFNYIAYKIIIKIIKALNILYTFFIKIHIERTLENNVKVSGIRNKIKKINQSSNVVYVSTYRSYLDSAYVNMAVDRYGLFTPRFFVEKKILKSRLIRRILKLMGGYFIDSGRLSNFVYREAAQNYLAVLIGHGVQVLFFPEMDISKDGNIGRINGEFISVVMDSLYKNAEEIALVPIEVSYFKKPAWFDTNGSGSALTLKKILDNRIKINFSEPIFVSDFSNSADMISGLSENINVKWRSDSHIFPHYLLCRIIKENNYTLKIEEADGLIAKSLDRYKTIKFKPQHIFKKGMGFILKNNIGTITNGELNIIAKEEIDYYSNLIYN